MCVSVDLIWAPYHQDPLHVWRVVDFEVDLGLCDCAEYWYLAAVDDHCAGVDMGNKESPN